MWSLDTSSFHFEDEDMIYKELQEKKREKKEDIKPKYDKIYKKIEKDNCKLKQDDKFIEFNEIRKDVKRLYSIRHEYKKLKYHYFKSDKRHLYDENESNIRKLKEKKKELKRYVDEMNFIDSKYTEEYIKLENINKEISELKKKMIEAIKHNSNRKRTLNKEISLKNIISIFENELTRTIGVKTNEFTDDVVTIRIYYFDILKSFMKNGFEINGEEYMFFSSSAGMIRTKKCMFIKKSTFERHSGTIYCGLNLGIINKERKINKNGIDITELGCNKNKFLAYTSLNCTASDVWEDFDIDKAIVVEDFETVVNGMVDYIDYNKYDEKNLWKITRKEMDIKIPTMDGCGICSDYTGMFRAPWCKGLFVEYPIVTFIKEARKKEKELNPDAKTKIGKVKDIYGKDYDILKDGIKYILTKSQFKMWKYYKDWDDYKTKFKENNCHACKCNEDEDNPNLAKISYQPFQTLYDMSDDELIDLLKDTNTSIQNIGKDKNSILKCLGAVKSNNKKNPYQQSLEVYPELLNDEYTKMLLKETKDSMVNNGRYGKIRVDGKYFFVLPDVYAFAEWLFLHHDKPVGLLDDGEVSCRSYDNNEEIGMIRSPHLNFSHCINTNKINDDTKRWYKSNGVYTSCHSLYSLELMCDWDGDSVMIYRNKVMIEAAKRIREKHHIVPLYYELKKAKDDFISNETLYKGLIDAFTGGNIGEVSNSICKIWNSGEIGEDELRAISYLTLWNNVVIDYAKTLWKPDKSKEMEVFLKQYTRKKLPFFFKYIPDKHKEEKNLEKINNSVINRLTYLVKDNRVVFKAKNCGEFDYTTMLKNKNIDTSTEISKSVINTFNYWNMNKKFIKHEDDKTEINFKNEYIKKRIGMKLDGIDDVVDVLVKHYYEDIKGKNKRALWDVYGDIILERIKDNIPKNSEVCDVCGKRFVKENPNQKTCSKECYKIIRRDYKTNKQREYRRICGHS